jgi:nitric oxide reductase NorD protein
LLLLTDGKPNDRDVYEGRYGVEDTRMALRATRQQGLQTFWVTIDQEAGGYSVVRDPAELPRCVPLLYARLAR